MKPVCSSLPQALFLSASTQLKLTLSEIMKILVCHQRLRIFTLSNRAVHGSVPGDKKMHPPPTAGVIGSDGSDHQRAAVGSGRSGSKIQKTAKIGVKTVKINP